MPVTECLARGYTFELNTGTDALPNWVPIGGINSFSHSPQANDADTTTFEDDGRMTHLKASRGDQWTVSGLYQEDPDTGDRDPGQEACEAWAGLIGPSSRKGFRITSPGGQIRSFLATATCTIGGGGNDDPSTWELALVTSGPIVNS